LEDSNIARVSEDSGIARVWEDSIHNNRGFHVLEDSGCNQDAFSASSIESTTEMTIYGSHVCHSCKGKVFVVRVH